MQRDTKEADKSIFSKLYFHYFCGKQFTQKPQKASIFFFLILCRNHIAVHQCEIMGLKVFSHIWICYGTVNGEIC